MSDTGPSTTGAATQLEKATLTIIAASDNPSAAGSPSLTFQFNPKEYTITKSANWARTNSQAAQEAGPIQWQGAGPKSMSLDIYLDASDSATGNVLTQTKLLFSCCTPTAKSTSAKEASGPFVIFGWGHQMSFTAVVKSVSVHFLMFRPNGDPYRARATIQLEEVDVPAPSQNPTSGALEAKRSYVMVEGETLAHLAQREYHDAGAWRAIAEANGIDDPLRVRGGDLVLVPARSEIGAANSGPAAIGNGASGDSPSGDSPSGDSASGDSASGSLVPAR
ncbi:MAG: peptidase M23 [Acidimicrobiales bacterium]